MNSGMDLRTSLQKTDSFDNSNMTKALKLSGFYDKRGGRDASSNSNLPINVSSSLLFDVLFAFIWVLLLIRFRQPMPIKSSIKVYKYTCTLQELQSLFKSLSLQTKKYFGNQMSGNEIIVQEKKNRQTCFVTGAYRTIRGH